MDNSNLTLYIDDLFLSPYTYSVFCALREKKLPFEMHEVHFEKNECTDPAFKGKTYTDLIPAIQHEGHFFSESLAILEYLDEYFSMPSIPRLLPHGLIQKTQARVLLNWYRSGLKELRNERSTETVFYDSLRSKNPLSPAAQEEVSELKNAIRTHLKPGAHFLFGEWSIADTETAFMLNRLIQNGDPLETEFKEYAQRILARPAAVEFMKRARKPYSSYYR